MSRFEAEIKSFEAAAQALEPTASQRAAMTEPVIRYAGEFLDKIYEKRTFVVDDNIGDGLYDSPISEDPIAIEEALRLVRDNIETPALNPASGGHMGYIAGGGLYPASLGDYLADVTNTYAGVYFVGPGAVRMEHMLIRWMAHLVGFPDSAGGDLTSGGSVANLVAVVTARDAHELRGEDFSHAVVYTTEQVHHCIDKALRIAGLGECITRHVEIDDRSRMRPDALDAAIRRDSETGLRPWLVIASAGTTDTGAVDPLNAIGEIAADHRLWYHIDAAYGGFFILCKDGPAMLRGLGRADSIVMDPHKGLFLPYGSGAVLVKDRKLLQRSQHYQANYMQDVEEAADEYSPADHSPELTRHFRGLRLWLPLKLFGVAPFRACLEEKLLLARHFHEEIQKMDGFEAGPVPDLSVVTYRYVPRRGDANDFNRRLVEAVRRDGRVFLTSTLIGDTFVMRMCALCFRTHLRTVNLALEILRDKAHALEREAS